MDRPRICVDFNEMLEDNLVLLSVSDKKRDSAGNLITMEAGLEVFIYQCDSNDDGEPDILVASGVVELNNHTGWSIGVKWCCRIDQNGIRHASELM